ncbi:MAG: GIY-YIG nuclease family protein [Thermodesulfovibrionales bacterium]|jgi:hypothetical protein|nr:GIY-YIG nuclease family protein [Thermodesulfovibrionales bacterium]
MENNNKGIKYDKKYFECTIWRFVTRRFSRVYLHEEGFFYLGEESENGRVILWEANDITQLCVNGQTNLTYGLPKPKPAGYTYDGGRGMTRNIYCDSLNLCPDCGRFYFPDDKKFSFSEYFGVSKYFGYDILRKQDIVSLYEEKKNNNEFEVLECKSKLCLERKEENLKLKLSSNDKDMRVETLIDALDGYYTSNIQNVSYDVHNDKGGFLYIIKAGKHVKIGIADDVKNRLKQIQGTCPIKLEIINFWKTNNNSYYENLLHKQFKQYRIHGEWFELPEDEINILLNARSAKEAIKIQTNNLDDK